MLPSCDHVYSSDKRWYVHHINHLRREYRGKMWTQIKGWKAKGEALDWGINVLESDVDAPSLSRRPGLLHTGTNSGYAAVNLAYHLLEYSGVIILLGFDMAMHGDKRHFFGNHPAGMNVASNYPEMLARFRTIKPGALGIEIWNCSRRSALERFKKYRLEDLT